MAPEIDDRHDLQALGAGYPINVCAPVYPEEALARGQEGWVLIEFSISTEGRVVNSTVIDSSPPEIFDASALEGMSKCRFSPKTSDNGIPMAVQDARVTVRYELPTE